MATSGTYNFNLDIDEIIQEATEMIGGEQTLGHEPKSARRSINLMLNDWQNRGILLWSIFTTAVTVDTSVTTYALADSVNDALIVTYRASAGATDTQLTRITLKNIMLYLKSHRQEDQHNMQLKEIYRIQLSFYILFLIIILVY